MHVDCKLKQPPMRFFIIELSKLFLTNVIMDPILNLVNQQFLLSQLVL